MDSSIFDDIPSKRDPTVYLITPNFAAPHIKKLLDLLGQKEIFVQLQNQTDSLGVKMDKRFFVVVDN